MPNSLYRYQYLGQVLSLVSVHDTLDLSVVPNRNYPGKQIRYLDISNGFVCRSLENVESISSIEMFKDTYFSL